MLKSESARLFISSRDSALQGDTRNTPSPPTNIVDFRGFDSSIILIQRGGILRPRGNLPESLSQAMLVGTMLLGRLGVVSELLENRLSRAAGRRKTTVGFQKLVF